MRRGLYVRVGKRLADVVISAVLLVALAPLLVILIITTAIFMGLPVFFVQERPGKNGKIFKMVKFRTMRTTPDPLAVNDAERLTLFGKVMRGSSLDELPELWNVLKGEMSIVGPRPLLTRYLDRYNTEQSRRHDVLPGITGWAQVNGRNAIGWDEKFKLDCWYVDNQSLSLDLKIALMTFARVISRAGVSAAGQATMPEFLGEKAEIGEP